MTESSAVVSTPPMTKDTGVQLTEQEQVRLIHAIESAIDVGRREQFDAWIRGPFRSLLQHDSVICLGLGPRGAADILSSINHGLIDASAKGVLDHPEQGLAVCLARKFSTNRRQSNVLAADELAIQMEDHGERCPQSTVGNAVIHRLRLISGANYYVVIFNVATNQLARCRQIFRLLASHLKMALSRAIADRASRQAMLLTQREMEILRWMKTGKSNREISQVLGISAITLKGHVSKIYRKLDVQNRDDAVARGLPNQ